LMPPADVGCSDVDVGAGAAVLSVEPSGAGESSPPETEQLMRDGGRETVGVRVGEIETETANSRQQTADSRQQTATTETAETETETLETSAKL
jgi:hypothetical protein